MRNVLQNPKNFSPDPRMFFSGLVVTCAEVLPIRGGLC